MAELPAARDRSAVRASGRRGTLPDGLWRFAAPLAVMAAIFVGSGRAMPVAVPSGGDKLLHFAVYALLAGCWTFALAPRAMSVSRKVLLAIVLTAGWGVSDELHQSFVPGRDASVGDVAADVAGALAGVCPALVVRWQRARQGRGSTPAAAGGEEGS